MGVIDRVARSSERYAPLRNPTTRDAFLEYLVVLNPKVTQVTDPYVREMWAAFEYREAEAAAKRRGNGAVERVRFAHAIEEQVSREYGVHVYTEGEAATTLLLHATAVRDGPANARHLDEIVNKLGAALRDLGFQRVVLLDTFGNRLTAETE